MSFHQQGYDGSAGSTCRSVSTASADATTLPEDLALPPGTRAVQVDLTLSADPEVPLTGCLAGRARRGGHPVRLRVERLGSDATRRAVRPGEREGAWPSLGGDDDVLSDPDDLPRPATWSVSPVVVVPEDVEVADVVLWWQKPQYLLLEVPR